MQKEQTCVLQKKKKNEAIGEFLPSVTISGSVSDQQNTNTGGNDSNFKPDQIKVETVIDKAMQYL